MKTENSGPSRNWRDALKPAGAAFGFGCFVGIASFYRGQQQLIGQQQLPFFARMFAGLFCGVVIGTVLANVTYLLAFAVYWLKGSRGAAPATTFAKDMTGIVAAAIFALFAVLWIMGKT